MHGWWALAPGIGVFAFWMLRLARNRALAVTLALGVLVLPLVLQRTTQAVRTLLVPRVTVRSPAGARGDEAPAEEATPHCRRSWPPWTIISRSTRRRPCSSTVVDAAIYTPLVPDLRNPSNIWFYDRFFPIPRPDEVEARRREFIRDRRPLLVYLLHDDPSHPSHRRPTNWRSRIGLIRVNRDRRANMEEILRNDHYVELALARVAEGHASLILLGPRD